MSVTHIAAGALFIAADTGRLLLNRRSRFTSNSGTWAFCGGMVNHNETIQEGLAREICEEMGKIPEFIHSYPLDIFHSADGQFNYYTLLIVVKSEFIPTLNRESDGYAWCNIGSWPQPLHPATKKLLHNKGIKKNIKWAFSQHNTKSSDP